MSQAARARKRTHGTRVLPASARGWKQSVDLSRVINGPKLALGIDAMIRGEYADAAQIMFELDNEEGPHYEARFFAAILAREAHDPLQSIDLLHEVVAQRPTWTEALYNLGVMYEEIGDNWSAETWFTRALAVDDEFASAWVNLGNMKLARGNVTMALDCFERAIALVPDQAEAKVNAAHALLMMGEWEQGWTYYEERWRTPAFRAKNGVKGTTAPMWDGSPLDGKTLLVFNEQGFGDTIIMLRFAPMLRALGAKLVFRVPPRLIDLVRHHLEEGEQVISETDELPPHDRIVPFMSLPYHLKITTQNVPGASGYLYQSLPRIERRVAVVYEGWSRERRIAVVWAGSPMHKNDRNRSMTPAIIAPLIRSTRNNNGDDNVTEWFSVQVGPHEERARELGLPVAKFCTFAETAQFLSAMDLLITVDTATAHLAGAMGVPTWLCIPAVPDMRWPLHGMTTPWYNSMRIFRQPTLGDWRSVVSDLHKALEAL